MGAGASKPAKKPAARRGDSYQRPPDFHKQLREDTVSYLETVALTVKANPALFEDASYSNRVKDLLATIEKSSRRPSLAHQAVLPPPKQQKEAAARCDNKPRGSAGFIQTTADPVFNRSSDQVRKLGSGNVVIQDVARNSDEESDELFKPAKRKKNKKKPHGTAVVRSKAADSKLNDSDSNDSDDSSSSRNSRMTAFRHSLARPGRSQGSPEDLLRMAMELCHGASMTSIESVSVAVAKKSAWLVNAEKCTIWIRRQKNLIAFVDRNTNATSFLDPNISKEKTELFKELQLDDPEGACVFHQESIFMDKDGNFSLDSVAPRAQTNSESGLWVPISLDGECYACLHVTNKVTDLTLFEEFTPDDETLLRSLNAFVVMVIRNSLLYLDLNKSYHHGEVLLDLVRSLATTDLNLEKLCFNIMDSAKRLLDAHRCSLFVVDHANCQLNARFEGHEKEIKLPLKAGIAGHVATTGEVCNITDAYADHRFNKDTDKETGYKTKSILCAPIVHNDTVLAVAQLVNKNNGTFTKEDEDTFAGFSVFAGINIQNTMLHEEMLREKRTISAILQTVKELNKMDIMKTDDICAQIMEAAKELVRCERCALFMVDKEHNELYSRVAIQASTEIRFPVSQGIAGHVARTSEVTNIKDAYADTRFNTDVDKRTGYVTRNILCMPVVFDNEVIAVAQLVNKIGEDYFNSNDEATLKVFSEFAAMSLRNAHLFQFMKRAEEESKALMNATSGGDPLTRAGDKASFVVTDMEEILKDAKAIKVTPQETATVLSWDFDIHRYHIRDKQSHLRLIPLAALIFEQLGFVDEFHIEKDTLFRFVIAVQSRYRQVPYHNFTHAFDVMQTLATWMQHCDLASYLSRIDMFTVLVSALCHDIDHMGLNNSFLLKVETPLGVLSASSGSKSVLEVHHCNIAIEILQNADYNILSGCSTPQTKEIWKTLIESILATDMARHGELCSALQGLEGDIKADPDQRRLVVSMLLKCADISNITKPFEISRIWGQYVTAEFEWQGDQEREAHMDVTPMFDRQNKQELAVGQLNFIRGVGVNLFTVMTKVVPTMGKILDMLLSNRNMWQSIIDSRTISAVTKKNAAVRRSDAK
ncbi:Dual 3prime [Diplonema papillatum]|nr:Dual 3prime [Diplonema papillatum]